MTTFAQAARSIRTQTENGMDAYESSSSRLVDLFFSIGASRGKDIIPQFVSGLVEDRDRAIRLALWARDARGGAGERQIFRDILKYLIVHEKAIASALIPKVPELGRWDDLFVYANTPLENKAFQFIKDELDNNNGSNLVAKWMPRKGSLAVKFREFCGWSPKYYRKRLVERSNGLSSCDIIPNDGNKYLIVESNMCAGNWDGIEYSKVPSLAHSRYKKAFGRHSPERYSEYAESLVKGETKINAGAVYPYDVLKGLVSSYYGIDYDNVQLTIIEEQWKALPNYLDGQKVLPLVDVSGSMMCPAGKNQNLTCLEVAVSLGLYCADKNVGKFKDLMLTFSARPELLTLKGTILQKIQQMEKSHWEMNTDIVAAFEKILKVAVDNNVPQEEMPDSLLIFSDMQFDACISGGTAFEVISDRYERAGYTLPQVIFWNLNARGNNIPVSFRQAGVALVSGFSPALLKSVLSGKSLNPYQIMDDVIMVDRYKWDKS